MDHDADLVGSFGAIADPPRDSGGDTVEQPSFFDTLGSAGFGAAHAHPDLEIDRSGPEAKAFFEALESASNEPIDRAKMLERCLKVQEHERLRIGQDLHDSTGQLLVSLQLTIAYLRHLDEGQGHDTVFDEISATIRRIDHEIRTIAYLNYPAELASGGLVGALRSLANGFGERTGLHVRFRLMCRRELAAGPAAMALLRVAQEAMVNIYRHASATSVCISLTERKEVLELSIQDDGKGMRHEDSDQPFQGVGLHGMRHRIESLGGQFVIPKVEIGSRVRAMLPIGQFDRSIAA